MSKKRSQEEVDSEKPGYLYQVTRQGRAKTLRISEEDYTILTVYSNLRKKPRTTIMHEMIGTAAKCWEEKHDEQLAELREWKKKTEDYELLVRIVEQKYGPLRVKRRNPHATQ